MTDFERLDVVIPTLNAAQGLPGTLRCLPKGVNVIISDGGSEDDTLAIARAAGCRILQGRRGRGYQLVAGAECASRPWRLFLHADTIVSGSGWDAIKQHISSTAREAEPDLAFAPAASLRLRIDDPSWKARLVEQGVELRVRLLGLAYGDQGLLIHRDLYASIGGYGDLPLMEDVDIIKRLGRSRHVTLDGYAITSAARWQRRGWMRQTALNLCCISLYHLGVSADRIARLYGR